jgi:hypothetical protein
MRAASDAVFPGSTKPTLITVPAGHVAHVCVAATAKALAPHTYPNVVQWNTPQLRHEVLLPSPKLNVPCAQSRHVAAFASAWKVPARHGRHCPPTHALPGAQSTHALPPKPALVSGGVGHMRHVSALPALAL